MGTSRLDPLDEALENWNRLGRQKKRCRLVGFGFLVVVIASLIYGGGVPAPPGLMDDVDSVQAQISRTMLESGDWVTARLNGVPYLEKSPLLYWMMAASFALFGVHDWASRIPLALCVIGLCWLTYRMGRWAFSPLAGCYAGLVLASCFGLWLFTRIQIPDAVLTGTVTLAMWSFLRVLDEREQRPRLWSVILAASMGAGVLLKGLIAIVLPVGACLAYLAVTKQIFDRAVWRRLHVVSGCFVVLLIAAPWHLLATLRNPPYFDLTMESVPGQYHGFFWFYFLNEHLFRFLNIRHPRDYNTVPRLAFWLFHFLWLFPWSVFLPSAWHLSYKPVDRASRARLLALCWAGFLLVFFTFSTTQEYYSMPCYPALALLIGCVLREQSRWMGASTKVLASICGVASLVLFLVLVGTIGVESPGDISRALSSNPELYTLSLGHMADLTLNAFAYLRWPLALALAAFLLGAVLAWRFRGFTLAVGLAAMMVLFCHAAKLALIQFDPYLGSRELAHALLRSPAGGLIVDNQYYAFSSIFFYTNRTALLLNGRVNNLEYGSYAPDAPKVFIDDGQLAKLWNEDKRWYLCVEAPAIEKIAGIVGRPNLHLIAERGGKAIFTNRSPE